eukprot:TRINITY_DN8265_c0_g1_i2.p2 TRINITY_DN8265_c0_g1~~TRINITY_DN8265_c0_g1_i2.p2  ORF type:complete len:177 (+),score=24.98 TRINITY_DN8265_c0_g1_i2:117-647(+)
MAFGSQEDSLGSVKSLQPKPPRKDLNKMYTQDQYILRFDARLVSENKDDQQRKFIISFFCGDDTIQAYEVAGKNTGIWKGKFIERMSHINPITKKPYTERDFQIGEILQFTVYKFQLLRADEYTHKYMKSKPEVFKEADIEFVLEKLKKKAREYSSIDEFLIYLIKKTRQEQKRQD